MFLAGTSILLTEPLVVSKGKSSENAVLEVKHGCTVEVQLKFKAALDLVNLCLQNIGLTWSCRHHASCQPKRTNPAYRKVAGIK